MSHRIRHHLSFANVTSVLALVFAMGGTGYALTIPKNSIGSSQIKRSAVANSDLRSNAVTSSKVRNGSLHAVDFAADQLPGSVSGATGPAGAIGPAGPTGPQGDTGATGTVGAATVQFLQAPSDLADGASGSYNVFCLAGQQAIGGGARGDETDSEATNVTSSRPAVSSVNSNPPANGQSFTGWRITVVNTSGGVTTGIKPEVWVVCVSAPAA
jgi:hypothetical protein